jgi:hypothetical protein
VPVDVEVLPAGSRLVHIGPHKTGSTAIQVALLEARPQLAGHGVVYATGGGSHRPDKAGWALGIRGKPAGSEPPPLKHWKRLVREVAAAGGQRVCVSNEDFGRATPEQARQLVADLGGDAVHVVAVARRLDRYLPSQWQERVKAGDTRPYDEWLRVVLDPDEGFDWDRKNVWYSHDLAQLVPRWAEVVGPERFTLILSDEADRALLPGTFERLLGLPAGTVRPNPSRSNRGLSLAETELVRSVHALLDDAGWTKPQRRRWVKGGVLADMQRRPVPPGPRSPALPRWAEATLRELSDRRVEQARSLGVRIVGDPESMRMPADVPVADGPSEPASLTPEVAAASVAAVVDLALRREHAAEG